MAKTHLISDLHNNVDRIVREDEREKITGLSRTTAWRLEKKGLFPKSIKLSTVAKGWMLSDLMAWLESRRAGDAAA